MRAEQVKAAANGRWLEIITALCGISADVLDGRHHPCPKCGGTDRFQAFGDFTEIGGVLCRRCHSSENGDGISTLQWASGVDFKTAMKMLAAHLGMKPTHKSNGKPEKPRLFATTQGVVRYFIENLSRDHGAGVKCVKSWSYDTFHVLRFNLPTPVGEKQRKEFRPVHQVPLGKEGQTAWALGYPKPDGGRPLYRRSEILASLDTSLVTIHGGEKAADAAAELELLATTNAGGEQATEKTDWAPVARFETAAIVCDNDDAGERFGRKMAVKLKTDKPELVVKLLQVSDEPKGDIVEAIRDGMTKATFLELAETAPVVTPEQIEEWGKTSRHSARHHPSAEIEVGPDESRVVDEAIATLAPLGGIYQRGRALCHVVEGTEPPRGIARQKDSPRIAQIPFARLRERLADAAVWYRPAGESERERIHPPDWVVKAIVARGRWEGVQPIEAVVESPVLRSDGTILQSPGYDPSTGLYLQSDLVLSIRERPTKDDALRARNELLEVACDFPLKSDEYRAAWLSSLLTMLARHAFDGPAPLFLIDGNVRGCGKSLLADVTGIIATGRPMPRMAIARDDDEIRKRITSIALAGEETVLLDNIAGMFGSPSLDAALTSRTWNDRRLGESEMTGGIPLSVTWFATGNNIQLQADTSKRVCHIRLESSDEAPEERSGFRHPDLCCYVRQNRTSLVAAALTVLSAFCEAGRPDQHLKPWGSFEAWSDLIRNAVVWCGLPDPGATRLELRTQSDHEAVALRQLIVGWQELDPHSHGLTVSEVVRELSDHQPDYEALRNALWELCPPRDGKALNVRSIGSKLHHLRLRVVGGHFFDKRDSNRGAMWLVRAVDGGSRGSSDSSIPCLAHASARAHAHTREAHETGSSTVTTAPSVTLAVDSATCPHANVVETPTHDGYVNLTCRDCRAPLGCRKQEQASLDKGATCQKTATPWRGRRRERPVADADCRTGGIQQRS
jgi:hypothetical protein